MGFYLLPPYRPVTAGVSILNTTSGIEYPRSPLQRRGHSRDVVRPNPMAAVEHRGALPGPRGGLHFGTREAVSGSSSLPPERVSMEGLGTSQSGRFVMCRYRGGGWVGVGGTSQGFNFYHSRAQPRCPLGSPARHGCSSLSWKLPDSPCQTPTCVDHHTLIVSRHASIPPKTNPSDWETRTSSRTTRGGREWMTRAG